MKEIRTTISDAEHKLLKEYAKRNAKSVKAVVHEAIMTTIYGSVNPKDPLFAFPPSSQQTEKVENGSVDHEKYLYDKKV
jgi:hypothetical protein